MSQHSTAPIIQNGLGHPSSPIVRGSTATKLARFLTFCERNPELVLEHIKERLARGAKPRELADQWNNGITSFLVEAGVDRPKATRSAIDRVIHKLLERDDGINPDTARFIRNLSDRANNSKLSLRRILADIERQALAMLAEPSAWPIYKEKHAHEELRVWKAKNEKSDKKVSTYLNARNSTFSSLKPAENRHVNLGLDEKTSILATRDPSPANTVNGDRFDG